MHTEIKKYSGVVIPAVTPLTGAYKLDHAAVEKMFVNFYKHDVLPFILGTTGESASLPNQLKFEYIHVAAKFKKPGTVLYAGISSNCFEESVELAKHCSDAGVDAVAATLPAYYTLSVSQMKKYFEQLADAIALPMIIYNIPSTTHMSIPLSLIDELSYHENIVGTKDSERSDERLKNSISLWSKREDFSHFLGWAARSAQALIEGSDGLIPSTGNLYPGLYQEMSVNAKQGNSEKAYRLQAISDLMGNLYQGGRTLGESLWALKVLMHETGLCEQYVMPPLQILQEEEAVKLIGQLNTILTDEGIVL